VFVFSIYSHELNLHFPSRLNSSIMRAAVRCFWFVVRHKRPLTTVFKRCIQSQDIARFTQTFPLTVVCPLTAEESGSQGRTDTEMLIWRQYLSPLRRRRRFWTWVWTLLYPAPGASLENAILLRTDLTDFLRSIQRTKSLHVQGRPYYPSIRNADL
jgi:hypothetical protein